MKDIREFKPGVVYFAGAGPGNVELLTLAARRLIERADMIIYAGSLVTPEILDFARPGIEILNSAHMKLEDQVAKMSEAAGKGYVIARIHTGDPSIFGAISEQMRALDQRGIHCEVIPGVSSVFAAAAALGIEYTLPEITQALILTRASGRTAVPEREKLSELAGHQSSLAIFLSAGLIDSVVSELQLAGYSPGTPVAVVYRASWPDQKILRGTLSGIAQQMSEYKLTRQCLIILSPALKCGLTNPSHLYGDYQKEYGSREGMAILALTAPSVDLGRRIKSSLEDAHLFIPHKFIHGCGAPEEGVFGFEGSIRPVIAKAFCSYRSLVCVMASGIVVRELGGLLTDKHSDPAVIVMDPQGRYAVSLLGGHEGGANQLARKLAALTGGQAVITTASDNRDIPALDVLARDCGWKLDEHSRLERVMGAFVNQEPVVLIRDKDLVLSSQLEDFPWEEQLFGWDYAKVDQFSKIVVITCRRIADDFWEKSPDAVVYYPPALTLGVGCNRGCGRDEIHAAVMDTLVKANLDGRSVGCLATIKAKADETGLLDFARSQGWTLKVYEAEEIRQVKNLPNPSIYAMKALGVEGVAEPAALLASGATSLLVEKQKYPNVTVAVGMLEGRS